MAKYKISLNQLADFSNASEASKRRIIKQQINPDTFRVPRYQLTKARIKKCLELKGDLEPVLDAIKVLESRKATTSWQINDRDVSVEALKRFAEIKIPSILKKIDYQVIRPETKEIEFRGVDIIVAPEIVIKGKLNGQTVIGGVKIHISKRNPFDLKKSQCVASVVYKYLKEKVANEVDLVVPELCFSLDVFNARLVPATADVEANLNYVRELCDQLKPLWDQVDK